MVPIFGHWAPSGASSTSAPASPATISRGGTVAHTVITTSDRVITQCRGTGRATMRSTSRLSTSPAGSVAE
jgi:hypothetical protein